MRSEGTVGQNKSRVKILEDKGLHSIRSLKTEERTGWGKLTTTRMDEEALWKPTTL